MNEPHEADGTRTPDEEGTRLPVTMLEGAAAISLPADALAIIPVRGMALFPGLVMPIGLGREASVAAAHQAIRSERPIGLLLQRDSLQDDPAATDLYSIGTTARIARYGAGQNGTHHMVCHGEDRFRVIEYLPGYPFMVARVERLAEVSVANGAIEARMYLLKERAIEALQLLPQMPNELASTIHGFRSPGGLADMVAGFMDIKPEQKQEILETIDIEARLDKVLALLAHRIAVMRLSREIGQRTQTSVDDRQREFILREQMKTIQRELGDEESADDLMELEAALANAAPPEEVASHIKKELKRLKRMSDSSAEYSMIRTYLDWIAELPWSTLTAQEIDLAEARRVLDADHSGLDKVKRRIVEYLAVRKLNRTGRAPILCFVGPPGVGKTSLGQSIARALGTKFVRVALGGVHDESEIRGHRRTYVGALPGNVVQALKKAGARDTVMLLDEVDKLGRGGFHGDPSAALLEVLDPEQNGTFRDAYLGVPFDLSRVTFIATANMLDTIPGPLRDRMEIIELPGYTEAEKVAIAAQHLVKKQIAVNGLSADQCSIGIDALATMVRDYTREAGVRALERRIGAVCRFVAVQIAEGKAATVNVSPAQLALILGPRKFENEVAMRTAVPGVATGLAWTPVGGDVLFIEASKTLGTGKLIVTGQLGDVMKESVQAAMTLVKSRAGEFGIEPASIDKHDVHVHVPAGATPKDGPSAGVAMFMALASLFSGRLVRNDTAMTGEISLRGIVLPVGGIKEKVLAALQAGIKRVLLPARNRHDFEEIPEEARRQLELVWLERVDDALCHGLTAIGGVAAHHTGRDERQSDEVALT
ncbi:MAG: endopeptidase La [Betaproteobacteria bacterium]|nr:endopeptidase La [Betaproteobacteria bacterium]